MPIHEFLFETTIMVDDDMAEQESKRALDELRDRLIRSAGGRRDKLITRDRKLVVLHRISYFVALIVFVVALVVSDFDAHPIEAAIFGFICAAVVLLIAILIVWAIGRFWTR